MAKEDGGPAFPCTTGTDGGVAFDGMSLRIWLAGMALQGILAHGESGNRMEFTPFVEIGKICFAYADQIIAEGKK